VATSIREFNIGLYLEHLDEASFLYEQRQAYLHDPEVNWPDLLDSEERFEAHIDALVVGGDLALDICRQHVVDCDDGQLHAALRVLCRHNRKEDVFGVLRTLDPTNRSAARAVAEALCREASTEWRDDLLRGLENEPQLTHILAHVIGYRRVPSENILRRKLAGDPPFGSAELVWALGRVGSSESLPLLSALLDSTNEHVCEAAALALMRLGDDRPVQRAMDGASSHGWARRILAIGGDQQSVSVLLDRIHRGPGDVDSVFALGLLGHLAAVGPLVELLEEEQLAEAAAVALNTITGAQLYARVFVPDVVDRDELSDEEREAFDNDGTLPTRNGEPYGDWERRPVVNAGSWRAWLDENKHRFNRSQRWRMGRPHGPAALLECLQSETTPYRVRAATYEELVVRFRLDVPFEVDLPVWQQRRFLRNIEGWVARQGGLFQDGSWYFAAHLQG
jgi:uncharacterized protein (TIGR02270 family)